MSTPEEHRKAFEDSTRNPAVTVSRVLMTGAATAPDREVIVKWAQWAAEHGGSFSVTHEWSASQWYSTWTINWPAGKTGEPTP